MALGRTEQRARQWACRRTGQRHRSARMAAAAVMFVAALAVQGCSFPFATGPSAFSSFEAISVVGTDKTLGDHVLSVYSGKNCSTVRSNNDLTYCEEDEPVPKKTGYCYRSLGNITCYDRPDPYKGDYVEVEQKIEPLIKRPNRR
jgi:hypothetical protein